MTTQKIFDFIRDEAARINEESYDHISVTEETVLADELDIDSLALMEICIRVEEVYGVHISDEEAGTIRTARDLHNHISVRS